MAKVIDFKIIGYDSVKASYSARLAGTPRITAQAGRRILDVLTAELIHNAPEDSGVFSDGIVQRFFEMGDRFQGMALATGEHAFLLRFIVDGTPRHPIPRGGSAEQLAKGYPLHWIDKQTGEDVFAWSVDHPGTAPNPFVDKSINDSRPFINKELSDAARAIAYLS